MAQAFTYKARTRAGELVEGEMEAPEAKTVAERLRELNYIIISIAEKHDKWEKDLFSGFNVKLDFGIFRRKVKTKEISFFCRHLATMVSAGIPLLAGLAVLHQQEGPEQLTEAIGGVKAELEQGQSFADGARKYGEAFPPLFINMVEAGEMGGALDEVLMRLADHFDKEHEVVEKVKSAMTYPMVILCVAITAIAFLVGFVLPKFTALLTSFNAELPLPTRIVMGMSYFVANYWYLLIILVGLAVYGVRKLLEVEKNKLWWDTFKLRMPIFGDLLKKREISFFARTLGMLLRSGVPLLQALEIVRKTTGNLYIREILTTAHQSIRDGQGLAAPLRRNGVFPPMVVQLIQTGEETGTLEEMLERVSDFFNREVDSIVGRLSSLIEPVFIVVLGVAIGGILLSVLLPVFEVISTVQ